MSLQELSGFGLALLAMVLYGLYMAPRSKTGITHEAYTYWMGVGILLGTLVVGAICGTIHRVTLGQYLIIFISGVVWGTGTAGYCKAVQLIGLSRSTPVKNLCAIFATLLGIIVFHEFTLRNSVSLALVIGGSLAIVLSATLLSGLQAPKDSTTAPKPTRRQLLYGLLCAFWAALAYSLYTVPMKLMYTQGVTPMGFLFYMGQGCFVGMAIPLLINRKATAKEIITWRDRCLAMLSGSTWAVGSLFANMAVKSIGIAVTWPLTKTTVIAALYGCFVLKEVDLPAHGSNFRYGILLSIAGVLMLALAMSKP